MKKYKCPFCHTTRFVIRYGQRGKVLRYLCKQCQKYFSFNPCFLDRKALLADHLEGLSFRTLATKYQLSTMTVWRVCQQELEKLPNNNQLTFNCCSRFSSTFVFDGKYFNVADSKNDWVLLWGVDYFKHDIPIIWVAPSESYHSWSKFFFYFRIINHYPELLVCDDNFNLKLAARQNFPSIKIQTCLNHFKENIRRDLKVRSDDTYQPFMLRIEEILGDKLSDLDLNKRLSALYQDWHQDPVALSVLTNIERQRSELLGYRGVPGAPLTSNLMEGLNSHLEARLQALRSFQTVSYAKLWLNGYVLKRRYDKYTDCRGKFRHLNGKRGVELTQKPGVDLPILF